MNKISSAIFTIVIASGAATVQAAGVDQAELAECKAQISDYYGGATDLQFVGKRRFHDGTQIKLAVHSQDPTTGYSKTRLANCWLGAENFQAYAGDGNKESMVAESGAPAPSTMDEALP